MVVVDAVDHPVQPRADAVVGLEVEDGAMSPVLDERPERVTTEQLDDHPAVRLVVERKTCEHEDRRQEDERGYRRVDASQPVEGRRLEDRRRGLQGLGTLSLR